MLLALIALLVLAALPTITYPLGRDQGEFATIGRGILDGKIPYIDLWNPKPPAVFYVYAAAMTAFGRTTEALRAIDLLMFPLIAIGLYVIARQIADQPVGFWAVLLFGVFYFTETFWTLTQNDGIALLPMTWAMVCAFTAGNNLSSRSAVWACAAGALTAWAIWFKYPFALFILPVVMAYWAAIRQIRPRDLIGFALGGLLIGIGGIVYMMAVGAWDALWESAVVTSSYTALGASETGNLLADGVIARLQHWGILFAVTFLAAFAYIYKCVSSSQAPHISNPAVKFWLTIILWLFVGLVIMFVQLKGYDYHWLPILPPLVIISALVLHRLCTGLANRLRTHPSLMMVLLSVPLISALVIVTWGQSLAYLCGQVPQKTYYQQFVAGDFYAHESTEMAGFLQERIAPGDSLFIFGFRPEIYYLSGLNPAVRFIFNFPLVADWYPPQWREETVEILWAALPPYVLVLEADYMPWVTGSQEDSHTLLLEYTELRNWLEFNYERETQIGPFLIWRRLPNPTS